MKWLHEMEQDLEKSYLSVSDKEFSTRYEGLTAGKVRSCRRKLGLLKQIHKKRIDLNSLVVQITLWCRAEADIRFCGDWFREHGIAYGVARNEKSQYAVFRQETDRLHAVEDGVHDKSWRHVWTPNI